MNKLWLLRPLDSSSGRWKPWYDKAFGFVVSAKSEGEARVAAAEECGDEGEDAWLSPAQSSCILLVASELNEAKIILRDFAAG
jgi:hypothetical protein